MTSRRGGFTLIELMITVAVIGILAALAFPSYRQYVRKSNRAEAQAFMMAVAARQQQFLVDTRGYAPTLAAAGLPTPANVDASYTLTLTVPAGATPTFMLRADQKPSQSGEPCGVLTIDQTGTKTADLPGGCW